MVRPRTARHGTLSGLNAHYRDGEDACASCLAAKRRDTAWRGEAQRLLGLEQPARIAELNAEHVAAGGLAARKYTAVRRELALEHPQRYREILAGLKRAGEAGSAA